MINVAIVGLGPHGKRFVQCVLGDQSLHLAAVVDHDIAKLQDSLIPESTQRCTTLSQLWTRSIDVLLIATNGPSHAPIALEAMDNGVRFILVTKPVATTLKDARLLQVTARQKNVRIAVDHGLRYDKSYQWIKERIETGTMGDLRSIYIQRTGIGLGCLGVHSFDLATFLAGAEIDTVTGWVDAPLGKNPRGEQFVDPGGLVVINYKNGVKALISQIEDGSGPMSVELNFTKARIRVDEKFKILEWVSKENPPLRNFNQEINPHKQEVSHDTVQLMSAVINDLVFTYSMKADIQWGVLSFEVLLATYLSSESNHAPVKLPINNPQAEARFLPVT